MANQVPRERLLDERGTRSVRLRTMNSEPSGRRIDPALGAAANELANRSGGRVQFIDSATAWGLVFDADIDDDGAPDRKPDRVHVCPQGAARLATWLVGAVARRYDGVSPAPVADWAGGDWTLDKRFDAPVGSCAAL